MSVVRSFNIFLDSHDVKQGSKGDNIQFTLARNGINCDDGEQIRFSLQHFNMYRNWLNVNKYNCNLILVDKTTSASNSNKSFTIEQLNYASVGDIAKELGNKLVTTLKSNYSTKTFTLTSSLPANDEANSNKMIEILITSTLHGYSDGDLKLLTLSTNGSVSDDTSELLGVVPGEDVSDDTSFLITFPDNNTIKFASQFPSQTSTEQYVYVKTDLGNQNLESSTLSNVSGTSHHSEDIVHSNILGKATIATDFVNYDSGNSQEYYIDLSVKHLASFRLFLTDSKNRELPGIVNQNTNKGNIKFTAVIRIDVIKRFEPQKLETPLLKTNLPGTFLSKVNMPLKQ